MEDKKKWKRMHNEGGGAVYGLGIIGGFIYTFQNSTSLTDGLIGIFQSLFWPAFLVYKAFELLGM